MTTKTPNIYQRINKVMQEVSYLKKDLKVQGYSAVSHDAVTATLRESMIKNGIVMTVSQERGVLAERENNAKMRLYDGAYTVKLTNIDDKDDCIAMNVNAQAYDNSDKAPGKAMSYATKYALLKTFMIETGENEESRAYDPNENLISASEVIEIQNLLEMADKKAEDMLNFFNNKGFDIKSLDQMSEAIFQQTKALLTNAIEKKNAA